IEVDDPRGTAVVSLDSVERQRADVDLFTYRRPRDGVVIGRVAWLANDDDEIPLQRPTMNLSDIRVEQQVLVTGRRGVPRPRVRPDTAQRWGMVSRVAEATPIQAVERGVADP